MKVGSLYVSLSANTGAFMKGMDAALKSVERFAREAKRVSAEVAAVSAVVAGLGIAAVRMASSVDGPTKAAMDQLQKSTQLLAVQVADLLLPAVRQLTAMFRSAANAVAGLDPELKKHITSFAVIAVQVAVAAKAFSMLSGVAGNVFGILRGGLAAISAVGLAPLLAIVGAVLAIITVIGFLHRAWVNNWGDIQGITQGVFENLGKAVDWLANLFAGMWDSIIDGAKKFVDAVLLGVEAVSKLTGAGFDVGPLREGFDGLFKDLKTGAFFKSALTFAKSVASETGDAFREGLDVIKDAALKALSFSGGNGGSARAPGSGGGVTAFANRFQTNDPRTMNSRDILNSVGPSAPKVDALGGFGGGRSSSAQQDMRDAAEAEVNYMLEKQKTANQLGEGMKATGKAIAAILIKNTGALGNMITNIASAAKDGGPWAALLAMFMELVTRMEGFKKVLDYFEFGLQSLADAIEPLFTGIFDVINTFTAVSSSIIRPLFKALGPLFEGFQKILEYLVPVLMDIGTLFEAIAPIINMIGTIIGKVFEALKPLFVLIGGIIKIITSVINGILIVLNGIVAAFGDENAKAEVDRIVKATKDMWDKTPEQQSAEAAQITSAFELAHANREAAQSVKDVSEELTNVPTGWKLATAQFEADLGLTAAGPGPGSTGGASTGGTTINGDVNVNTDPRTAEELAEAMRKAAERARARRTGNPGGSDGRWGDD